MAKSDFTKTGIQVEREILDLIDSVDRSLDSSSGESERKGQLVLTAFLSVVVFLSVLAFEHLVGAKKKHVDTVIADSQPVGKVLNVSDLSLTASYLARIETNAAAVLETKNRVAPSMLVDGQIGAIKDSVSDVRHILGIRNPPASDSRGSQQ
ncbi:hypothetical protein [Lysobacter silvisoli]|uniref:hypothetical protein n=1 Tax=Lysobacter silvisoli TaxID=2293254 RepID=UPI0011C07BC0|nr:hypothetical protein [Lysobacter silvisoli]